jgi:isopropylmalate/homocitrate/citramalate synthase
MRIYADFCGIDIDTSVLGIGERNGICPLGALVSYTLAPRNLFVV